MLKIRVARGLLAALLLAAAVWPVGARGEEQSNTELAKKAQNRIPKGLEEYAVGID